MQSQDGVLYVVATPIGNLEDISRRAVSVLSTVDCVLAEDTRHSQRLLGSLGLNRRCEALHEHNEQQRVPALIERLQAGASMALISDAGTPLVSDPGFRLVSACHEAGVRVSPLPGACAPVAALSVSGLPTDQFTFYGFLPSKSSKRQQRFEQLSQASGTLVFFESSHRIAECLIDAKNALGEQRRAVLAREVTKRFETIRRADLASLADWVAQDPNQQRGEFVLIIEGAPPKGAGQASLMPWLKALLDELPPKRAAAIVAKVGGVERREVYQWALALKGAKGTED